MQAAIDLYMAQPFWLWIAVAAVLLAVEIMTGSGWLLWAAASAAVVGAGTGMASLSLPTQVLLFAVLTIGSTLLARRYLPRSVAAGGGDINDNIGRLVGHTGTAVGAFAARAGRVFIDGKEWAAELDADEALEDGARVEVTGVNGSRLRVRRA